VNAQQPADILGVNRRRHGDLLEMLRALREPRALACADNVVIETFAWHRQSPQRLYVTTAEARALLEAFVPRT